MEIEIWQRWTVVLLVILSVLFILFFLSRFTLKRCLPNNSNKRTSILSWLTTLVLSPAILYFVAYLIFNPNFPDLRDILDGWEVKTTYQIYPSKTISIIDNEIEIISGENNVLIVSVDVSPVVKEGETEPSDLQRITNLVIELSKSDTLVNPANLGSSKIIREIQAFSLDYGAKPLDKGEKIEIRRIGSNRWEINSDLKDFQFKGEFCFNDSSKITTKYIDEW